MLCKICLQNYGNCLLQHKSCVSVLMCPRADPEIFFGGVNLFICVWSKGHFYINLIGILHSLGGVH